MAGPRDLGDGVELVAVDGRDALCDRVIAERDTLRAAGLRLLRLYLHEGFDESRGAFHLDTIEVLAAGDVDRGDVVLTYSFTANDDAEAEGYTFFDVGLRDHGDDTPLWPFRLGVTFR